MKRRQLTVTEASRHTGFSTAIIYAAIRKRQLRQTARSGVKTVALTELDRWARRKAKKAGRLPLGSVEADFARSVALSLQAQSEYAAAHFHERRRKCTEEREACRTCGELASSFQQTIERVQEYSRDFHPRKVWDER
jgi:predicted DNA-binding transcriptional regulator AlpA